MGQFTQLDPIGLAGGLNLYGYANSDPVNFRDPSGLSACEGYDDVVSCINGAVEGTNANDGVFTTTGEECPLCVGLAAWAVIEFGLSAVDAIQVARVLANPTASGREKFSTTALAVLGILAPGGGYSIVGRSAGRVSAQQARNGIRTAFHTIVQGGDTAARDVFAKYTRSGFPNLSPGDMARFSLNDADGFMYLRRASDGAYKIEVTNHTHGVFEKITFTQR